MDFYTKCSLMFSVLIIDFDCGESMLKYSSDCPLLLLLVRNEAARIGVHGLAPPTLWQRVCHIAMWLDVAAESSADGCAECPGRCTDPSWPGARSAYVHQP